MEEKKKKKICTEGGLRCFQDCYFGLVFAILFICLSLQYIGLD